MINYPTAEIGNKKYEYYCIKYGSLLRNIRFIEYDVILLFYLENLALEYEALVQTLQLSHSLLL